MIKLLSDKTYKLFLAGITVFSMFFGAGNLIYPLYIGAFIGNDYIYGILGLAISGVLLPFIGLVGIILNKGNIEVFFGSIGKFPSFCITAAIVAIIGPAGALTRCMIVSFGGFKTLFHDAIDEVFYVLLSGFMIICISNKSKIIDVIGKYLTPFFLFSIIVIIIYTVIAPTEPGSFTTQEVYLSHSDSFMFGLTQGYQTLDLCTAFFFGKIIYDYFAQLMFSKNEVDSMKYSVVSCIIGVLILLVLYSFLVYSGAKFSDYLHNFPKQFLISAISTKVLGNSSQIVAAFTIFFACITTAIALLELTVDYVLKKIDTNSRLTASLYVMLFANAVILIGFDNLAKMIGGVLYFLYPSLILLTLANMITYFYPRITLGKPAFWGMLVANVLISLYGLS